MDLARRMRDVYDRHAAEYAMETGSYEGFPGLRDEVDRFYAEALGKGPLLDLGCGAGRDTEYLIAHNRDVVAGDLSTEMLNVTRARCNDLMLVVQFDLRALPFREDVFAGIWASASLLHIPSSDMFGALTELYRTLRPGGAVAISMKEGEGEGWHSGKSHPDRRWFTFVWPEAFVQQMASAGFVRARSTSSGRRNWFITEGQKPTRK